MEINLNTKLQFKIQLAKMNKLKTFLKGISMIGKAIVKTATTAVRIAPKLVSSAPDPSPMELLKEAKMLRAKLPASALLPPGKSAIHSEKYLPPKDPQFRGAGAFTRARLQKGMTSEQKELDERFGDEAFHPQI